MAGTLAKRLRAFVFTLLLITLVALAFHIGQATAWTKQPTLSAVASVFAQRSVAVRCYSEDEKGSPGGLGAWGYVRVPIGKAKYEAVDGSLCDAALSVNDPTVDAFHRALGVLVVVHESYHLRRWGNAGIEGKVECQAIRHWKVAAHMLGATDETVAALWPMALAAHYEETNITVIRQEGYGVVVERPYYDEGCITPPLVPDPPTT